MQGSTYNKDDALTADIAAKIKSNTSFSLSGSAGSSAFVTVDFGYPAHGYPVLQLGASQSAGVVVDFGYTEKTFDLYSGNVFLNASGWLVRLGYIAGITAVVSFFTHILTHVVLSPPS